MVLSFPEMKKLQDVLPGRACRHYSQDVFLLDFYSWQAVCDLKKVIQGEILEAIASGELSLTVVYTLYDAIELVLVFVPLPPQSQQLQDLLLGGASFLQSLKALTVNSPSWETLQEPFKRDSG